MYVALSHCGYGRDTVDKREREWAVEKDILENKQANKKPQNLVQAIPIHK